MSKPAFPGQPVLLIDDDEHFLHGVSLTLRSNGINNLELCSDSRQVPDLIGARQFSAVLLDLSMPGLGGTELLPLLSREIPETPVIVVTAAAQIEIAVRCIKSGAYDYLVKPVDDNRLVTSLRHALASRAMHSENALLREYLLTGKLMRPEAFARIITASPAMRAIFQYIEAIGPSPFPVLITGETGVGKEMMAEAIHLTSGRSGPLVPLNVAGLDDTMFADTLFGHRKGAFTGADQNREGLIEKAAGGTLFLDEIGDLSIASQLKLLRLLQERDYYPLGSDVPKLVNARIVVATNQDPESLKSSASFRRDLFYRLKTHHVHIPPLRERREDLPLLIDHFLHQAAQAMGKEQPVPPREMLTLLSNHDFPGNIRELQALINDAVGRSAAGKLSMAVIRAHVGGPASARPHSTPEEVGGLLGFTHRLPTLKQAARLVVAEALRRTKGNQRLAARLLGISPQALSKRLKEHAETASSSDQQL
jgi:DNA-binding NtrC family response regulator